MAQRKLIPALQHLCQQGYLQHTRIVGISRRAITLDEVFGTIPDQRTAAELRQRTTLHTMDVANPADYQALKHHLDALTAHTAPAPHVLFYLSVPPQAAVPIVEMLGHAGLNDPARVKVLLEKPFGIDLSSARESIDMIGRYFAEDQLYRIDHYLAKEMAQNIIAFRGHNALFRHVWHRDFIERIDIVASETIGIEGRAGFYEQTGALRDFVQNHLMQLAALILMDILDETDIPGQRLRALEAVQPIDLRTVVRGQYDGYQQEVSNPGSVVETFAAITLHSTAERWQGVPVRLITGKCLNEQTTEVRIYFKKSRVNETNQLILHIQPKQGIEIDLWVKRPGYEKAYEKVDLHFHYPATAGEPVEAYERVLVDALQSDKNLFTTAGEVLRSWELLEPIQHHWAMQSKDVIQYKPGSTIEEVIHGQ